MDLATTIAIVAPNAVAVTAITVGWKQQGRGLREGRRLADLDDVRGILDDAAVRLHRTAYTLDRVRSNLTQFGRGFFEAEERAGPYFKLEKDGEKLDALVERLRVRLGRDHAVAVALREASEAALAIYRALQRVKLDEPGAAPDEFVAREITEFFERARTEIEAQRETFDSRRADFIDSAQRTAGADLPSGHK